MEHWFTRTVAILPPMFIAFCRCIGRILRWLVRMCEVPQDEPRDEMMILGFCRSGW